MPDLTPLELYQRAEIEAGLAQANRGEFATDEEVAAVFAKVGVAWRPNAKSPLRPEPDEGCANS
jgi:predicted transcriptional regulator